MINCIAIDRDSEALAELSSHIGRIPFLSLSGTYSNPLEANDVLARRSVDLLFADPDMDLINGIDFVRSLIHKPLVVFIAKSNDYAVEAFNAGVLDYILKPVTLERLIRVANKAYELVLPHEMEHPSPSPANAGQSYLFIKVDNRMQRFNTNDILFIEGYGDYVKVYTTGSKPVIASLNMKNIERKLPQERFCRVHRSYIVSLSRIDSIERKRIRIGERVIPISNFYYPGLFRAIDAGINS